MKETFIYVKLIRFKIYLSFIQTLLIIVLFKYVYKFIESEYNIYKCDTTIHNNFFI